MLLLSLLYYKSEKDSYFNLLKSQMHNKSSFISSKITYSHMLNKKIDIKTLISDLDYSISLYSIDKKKIIGNLNHINEFDHHIYEKDNKYILIDDSVLGHLGVFYIVIEENLFYKKVKKLEINIIIFCLLFYSIIILIGVFLSKLFVQPIKEERIRLDNFIKDTTHELNTPITAILMSCESNNLSEKQIQRIKLSANRISEIYKDLTYVFLKNKDKEMIYEFLNLEELINEQVDYFRPLFSKKKITVNVNTKEFIYKIDKDDFIRLFNNLISNAIKYNKMKGEINISLENNILIIDDTGIGISPNKLKDIYKRYYRATDEQGGFGIGLNIVNHICKRYNIKISVKSKEKAFTQFTLKF